MTTETGGLVIDEGRLARAVHLDATRLGSGRCYQVTGGARTHVVHLADSGPLCDCRDFALGTMRCKHVIRVDLANGDRDVIAALRRLLPYPSRTSARGPA